MSTHKFVICTENTGYEASLELRKLYELLPDQTASKHGQVRVIDESGESYVYPSSFFVPLDLSPDIANQVAHT